MTTPPLAIDRDVAVGSQDMGRMPILGHCRLPGVIVSPLDRVPRGAMTRGKRALLRRSLARSPVVGEVVSFDRSGTVRASEALDAGRLRRPGFAQEGAAHGPFKW